MELYIHIPFCVKKCNYCDFLSFDCLNNQIPAYIEALKKDLIANAQINDSITSIFIGGGTPSHIKAEYIAEIMQTVYSNYNVSSTAEITIEVNPCTVSLEKLSIYKSNGINRVSMGVQSFNDDTLKELGRVHDSVTARKAFEMLRKAGFENVSIDLISCVPTETSEDFYNSLKTAIELKPEHISVYQLIIEEGTPFYTKYGPESGFEANLDEEANVYLTTIKMLENEGYMQYEISNFSRPGYESKHNSGYWEMTPYIGCGLGASGFHNGYRTKKAEVLDAYLADPIFEIKEKVDVEEMQNEFVFLGMRMNKGINLLKYKELFSEDFPSRYSQVLDKYIPDYVTKNDNNYCFTTKGMLVSNVILAELI